MENSMTIILMAIWSEEHGAEKLDTQKERETPQARHAAMEPDSFGV